LIHQFHLSPRRGSGVCCVEIGAFVGAIPMLARTRKDGKDEWRPRDCDALSREMSAQYGLPIDMSSKRDGLAVIAKALNEGDLPRAQIATVLLGVPDPPYLSKGAPSRPEMMKLASDLRWSRLLKADWDPDEHPRWPAGSADGRGGEFAPKGEGGETGASPISQADPTSHVGSRPDTRIQLADAGISDASDDPTAEAAARAAEAEHNASAEAKPADSEHEGIWRRLGSELSEGTKALIAEIGRAQIEQDNADLATATAMANVVARTTRAYDEYRAQPRFRSDGQPFLVPVINTGDPLSDQAAMMGELSKPNPQLLRPATNADWLDPLVNLLSLAAGFVGPATRAVRLGVEGVEAVEGAEVAAVSAETAPYRATVGNALTNNYRKTFFEAYPELEGKVWVHHSIPQIVLKRYPGLFTESEIHSLENLRGIPNELNSELHLSKIAKEWTQFFSANPNATRQQLLQKATEIDLKYGRFFKPPVGGGK
jgi:hypothetical protein